MPFWWEVFLYAFYVDICIFTAWAMPQISTELKHGEAVFHHPLAEFGIVLSILFGFYRQIEKNHDPHNTVFVEAHNSSSQFRINQFLCSSFKALGQGGRSALGGNHQRASLIIHYRIDCGNAKKLSFCGWV